MYTVTCPPNPPPHRLPVHARGTRPSRLRQATKLKARMLMEGDAMGASQITINGRLLSAYVADQTQD